MPGEVERNRFIFRLFMLTVPRVAYGFLGSAMVHRCASDPDGPIIGGAPGFDLVGLSALKSSLHVHLALGTCFSEGYESVNTHDGSQQGSPLVEMSILVLVGELVLVTYLRRLSVAKFP